MSADGLQEAMAIAARGPRVSRDAAALGRFGMGLKTASFSQAARLTVWTRDQGGEPHVRVWDLEHVVNSGQWQLLHEPDGAGRLILDQLLGAMQGSGTIVLWQKLTKIVDEVGELDAQDGHIHFLHAIAGVEKHLGMIFGRFLAPKTRSRRIRRIQLYVNGNAVEPWDPFMQWHDATLLRPTEHLEIGGKKVTVKPYVLPPKRRLSDQQYLDGGGDTGWLERQGFYVYRNDRMIVSGGWLGLSNFRSDEKHVLARIAIDIPASVDQLWSIDVKKAGAHPPLPLRGALTRTAKATRAEAQRVLSAIGKVAARTQSDELSYVWRPDHDNGQLRLRLNWQHPLVKEALRSSDDGRPVVKALLRFIEETVPLSALRVMFDSDEDRDYQPFTSCPPTEVLAIAERMYGASVSCDLTTVQAKTRLQRTSPFDEYPDLLPMLNLS